MKRAWFIVILAGVIGLIALTQPKAEKSNAEKPTVAAAAPKPKPRFVTNCSSPAQPVSSTPAQNVETEARRAAQRGLDFLGQKSVAWYEANRCYGCHVHAVTLEAMAVGIHHQYRVDKNHLDVVLRAMLEAPDGARGPHGLSHQNGSWSESAKELGGAAFARFDDWVDGRVRDDLLTTARQLLEFQNPDGSLRESTTGYRPVIAGPLQATYLALATWRQAYNRTADDAWLAPIRKAEAYTQSEARRLAKLPLANTQEVNYALMGLAAAGAAPTEDTVATLRRRLLDSQRSDGGFGFTAGDQSNPFATGQSSYALRLAGLTDGDPSVERATRWLIAHQKEDGGWSASGFGKAEAMWGVLGLVSVDVLSVRLAGIEDGQHVSGAIELSAQAADNDKAGGVVKVELAIDDVPTFGKCGEQLKYRWDTAELAPGKHFVDVIATNAKGKTSRRRFEVFAGPHYMTDLGSRFVDGGTAITLRDIAPRAMRHQIRLAIKTSEKKEEIFTTAQAGEQGPLSFHWTGKQNGKYLAELSFVDEKGAVLQKEEFIFMHDTPEAQRNQYGEIRGELGSSIGGLLGNTRVELVDDQGNVVQSSWTNNDGRFRFKNVDDGKYKVRVQGKKGFADNETTVQAQRSRESAADMNLMAH